MSIPADKVDGIYAAYFTGLTAVSFGLFVFREGIVAGGDAGGGIYNGTYTSSKDQLDGEIVLTGPSEMMLITGLVVGSAPLEMKIPFRLPLPIEEEKVVRFETPAGPVNGKLKLIRHLP